MRKVRLMVGMLVLMIAGIVFLVDGISDKIALSKPTADLSELKPSELKKGMMVSGTIYEIWDEFAYEEDDNGNVTSYYAFPLESTFEDDEPVFIALKLANSIDKNKADKMCKESYNYYVENIEPAVWTELIIHGQVSNMKGEVLDVFEEYIDEIGYDKTDNMEAFVISRFVPGSENIALIVGGIMTFIGLLGFGIPLVFVIIKR